MELTLTDIMILFILAIVVAIIIGMNVVYLVDKKLNDIKINIPPAKCVPCPCPIITTNQINQIRKPTLTRLSNENKLNNLTLNKKQTIEGFDVIKSQDDSIKQDDSDKQDYVTRIQQTTPILVTDKDGVKRVIISPGYNTNDPLSPNQGDAITYPREADIIRYNLKGCYQSTNTSNNINTNTNTNLNQNRSSNVTDISKVGCKVNNQTDAINKIKTSTISPSGHLVHQDVDIYMPKVYMGGDPQILGTSYASMSVGGPADIDQIGSIPVNDYNGEPVPLSSFAGY